MAAVTENTIAALEEGTAGEASALSSSSAGKKAKQLTKMDRSGTGGLFTLELKDVSYSVSVSDGKKSQVDKVLVQPTNLKLKPREMTAIMGASGAGKSTMLDILSARVPFSETTGEYTINGDVITSASKFKRISGYVMQSDALYPLLTVRETLRIAAKLRIPGMSMSERVVMADEMLDVLGLQACADTRVGDERVRGVSGGEKRRVSIGVDIVHRPQIIFLDEPTSGLDSTTALQVVDTLGQICEDGRTLAMTIHQPSTRVFESFQRVIFLSKGHIVFNGPPTGLANYMSGTLGTHVPEHTNLSESFLELVSGFEEDGNLQQLVDKHATEQRTRQLSNMEPVEVVAEEASVYANDIFTESLILAKRALVSIVRTPELFLARFMLSILTGLVLGSLYFDTPETPAGMEDYAGVLFFVLAFYIFTSMEALPVFLNEKAVFVREQGRGAYRAASYVIATYVIYIPLYLLVTLALNAVIFWMVGFPGGFSSFLFNVLILWFVLMMGNAFATFISGVVDDALVGNGMGTAILAYMFLFSGFFIPRDSMPDGWKWFSYLSMFKYPFESLMKNVTREVDEPVAGNAEIRFNIDDVNRWTGLWVMLLFCVGWKVLFYITLKLRHTGARG